MSGVVHIIGAGLAGLSAATALAGKAPVRLYEAARMAGGRCRSWYDPALGLEIDNGNHLLLSCNQAALDYLARTGAPEGALAGPGSSLFDFCDLRDGTRWRLAPNDGRFPFWIFSSRRRVPGSGLIDYLSGARLLLAGESTTVAQALPTHGALWERLWKPVLVSALNTQLHEASARLAAAVVRESLARGGAMARPLTPALGLGAAFVTPALAMLMRAGAEIRYGARARGLRLENGRLAALQFAEGEVVLGPDDRAILAVPAWIARELAPEISAPSEHRAILNAHFAVEPPADMPPFVGIVGGVSEWLFRFPGRLSITVSAADHLSEDGRDDLVQTIWKEVREVARLGDAPLPRHRIVREKRATFAATPGQERLRPGAESPWPNLFLAGDWTRTGLPATIEGAIRSGDRAAALALAAGAP